MSKFSFVDKANIQNNNFFLDKDESHHLINVLRFKVDSTIWLTDGEGGTYHCRIDNFTNKNIVEGSVIESYVNQNELSYHIHLGLPIIKNSRMKIAVEKSVELGIKELTPLYLDRSIKSTVSTQKMTSVMRSGVKQSMRSIIPKINSVSKLEQWYDSEALNVVASIEAEDTLTFFKDEVISAVNANKKIAILIGPEGGFSLKEKEFINDNKFLKVSVAKAVLRAETAVVSILSILNELMVQYE
ncbi:16S rRNA (uracil(1498)-N(3))-methyltransferase [Candidatus Marinimicrobia bacterium]|nr:16S rRNA (uracil(1498)-N(3))-methyltransferase [Candidatus Neomarinimicrobiota bacterium]MDC3287398.1 16S rRNA (uracil(1498)-N(3))-methyltransferase [Candidatus Neomarinimicrobiota bacterium]